MENLMFEKQLSYAFRKYLVPVMSLKCATYTDYTKREDLICKMLVSDKSNKYAYTGFNYVINGVTHFKRFNWQEYDYVMRFFHNQYEKMRSVKNDAFFRPQHKHESLLCDCKHMYKRILTRKDAPACNNYGPNHDEPCPNINNCPYRTNTETMRFNINPKIKHPMNWD